MEENVVKTAGFLKAQNAVMEYVKSGKSVSDLTKKDEVYQIVQNTTIKDKSGRRLTVEERFSVLGFPRQAKRGFDKLAVIFECFDSFQKRTGKPVDQMSSTDPEYKKIKELKVVVDGKRLSLQEKFALGGVDRERRYSADVKADLIKDIDEYLAGGGSFHVNRKSLPFFERLETYRRGLRENGIDLTNDQAMKSLGYRNYSDTYFRCMKLEELKNFRDDEGFCDAYRTDTQMKNYVISLAETLEVPLSVVVCLIAGEKLKKHSLDTDYLTFLKAGLENYYLTYGSLKGISANDPKLYNRLQHANRYIITETGEKTSALDVLKYLQLDDIENDFKSPRKQKIDDKKAIERARAVSAERGETLKAEDLSTSDYLLLQDKAIRHGVPLEAYLAMNGVEYDGCNVPRLSHVILDYYPFMDQMIARRDELLKESGVSEENGYTKEEVFEKNVEFSVQAFNEYRTKILNFEENLELGKEWK